MLRPTAVYLHRSEGCRPALSLRRESGPPFAPPMMHCCDPPQTGQPSPPGSELRTSVCPQPEEEGQLNDYSNIFITL